MRSCFISLFMTFLSISICTYAQENDTYINGETMLSGGIKLYNEEKYEEALSYFQKIHPCDEYYPNSLYESAMTLLALDKPEEALAYLEKEKAYPDALDIQYYNLLGNTLDDLQRREEAKAVYKQAYANYSHTWLIPYNYGLNCYFSGNFEETRKILEKNIRVNPYHVGSHIMLGVTNYAEGRLVPALICFVFASAINTSNETASRTFNLFENALKGDLTDMVESESVGKVKTTPATDDLNQQFQELEFLIKNSLVNDDKFAVKAKIDYSTTRQLQFLIENLKVKPGKDDVYNQLYIPFFSQMEEKKLTEAFIYYFVRFSSNEDIAKQLDKNKSKIKDYITWAETFIDTGREKLFNPSDKMSYTFNKAGIASVGCYSDNKKKTKTGEWTFFHDSGNKEAEGSYLDNLQEGPWKFYYQNGKLNKTSTFRKDKENGENTLYHSNGVISEKSNQINGLTEGPAQTYNMSGNLSTQMNFRNDKINGPFLHYYDNGNTSYSLNYSDSKTQGEYRSFYANKTLQASGLYQNNVPEGTFTYYHENGSKSNVFQFRNGKKVGHHQFWYPNGTLLADYTTNNDESIIGIYRKYHSNGILSDSATYNEKGILSGTSSYYNREGKLHYTVTYDNGEPTDYTYYDTSGKVIASDKRSNHQINCKLYDSDGWVIQQGTIKGKEIEGPWTFFDPFGNTTEKANYTDGVLDGEHITYFSPSGKIQSKDFYTEGQSNAYYVKYFFNGQPELEGYTQKALKVGPWKNFYPNGLLEVEHFYNQEGDLQGTQTYYACDGKKDYEEVYENGYLNKYTCYNDQGQAQSSCELKNGNGHFLLKHPNGKTYYDCKNTFGGLFNDTLKIYNINGILLYQGFHINGEKEGIQTYFNDSGEKTIEMNCVANKNHGKVKTYENNKLISEVDFILNSPVKRVNFYPNGQKSYECPYNEKQNRDGIASYYDESGILAYNLLMTDGLITGYSYPDKSGKLTEKKLSKGKEEIVIYYPNGNKVLEMTVINGWREGSCKKWYSNGKPSLESNYLNDELEGVFKEYSSSGILTLQSVHAYGTQDGIEKKYDNNGKLISEETYSLGKLHGTCKYYHPDGRIKYTRIYRNDLLLSENNGK